ncbi:MAG: serine/threonine protein kinase [Pirellulales bacterium]|nr:serine/threonine protein kinase [Pirellulales bacterium]
MHTIPSRLGPFALEEQLGSPDRSHTYRAIHIERRVALAIRILPHGILSCPNEVTAFVSDLAALKPLIHENIVRCLGGAVADGWPHIVFEFVSGESLAEQLDRRGKIPWEGAVDIAQGICRGLAYAHSKGFLHERLSAEKVLLDGSGKVKLGGLATIRVERHLGLARDRRNLHQAIYLAPELLDGGTTSTEQSDLHSVGCLLFQMLTGRPPFVANSTAALAIAKKTMVPPRLTSLEMACPVWLDVLIERLLAPNPKDRPASASDLLDALAETKRVVASGMGTAQRTLARKESALVRQGDKEDEAELARIRRKRSHRPDQSPFYERAWFLAGCLLLLVTGTIWFLWPPSEAALFQRATTLMASDDVTDWYRAERDCLLPLKRRFPNGQYAKQVADYLDQIEMDRAMKRLRFNTQLGRPRSCEGERLFAQAWEFEQFGDRVTALARYQALVHLLSASNESTDRPYVNLARQQIEKIGRCQGNSHESQLAFIQRHLDRADELVTTGHVQAARQIWESVVALYEGNRELAAQVDQARDRITALDQSEKKPDPDSP